MKKMARLSTPPDNGNRHLSVSIFMEENVSVIELVKRTLLPLLAELLAKKLTGLTIVSTRHCSRLSVNLESGGNKLIR